MQNSAFPYKRMNGYSQNVVNKPKDKTNPKNNMYISKQTQHNHFAHNYYASAEFASIENRTSNLMIHSQITVESPQVE